MNREDFFSSLNRISSLLQQVFPHFFLNYLRLHVGEDPEKIYEINYATEFWP